MTAVILQFKRPVVDNVILCAECGREATHRIELINVDMNHAFARYKYFCTEHFPQDVQGGD